MTLTALPERWASTYTLDDQVDSSITVLSSGGYVVTWTSGAFDGSGRHQDNAGLGIFAQRFDAVGNPVGGEFQVNASTPNNQIQSHVVALADGGFAVFWSEFLYGNIASNYSIQGQRFDANGSKVGAQFVVDASGSSQPSAALLTDGSLMVTYTDTAGSQYDIYAQHLSVAGTPIGSRTQVTTANGFSKYEPDIKALPGGGFIVTWYSDGQDGSGGGIYAKRFDASGAAAGSEFQVHTATVPASQVTPRVAVLADGGWVVTWSASNGLDGDGWGMFGRRFTADGTPAGAEFQINSWTEGDQNAQSVVALADGGFVVAWTSSTADGNSYGAMAQRFAADGSRIGGEFALSYTRMGSQGQPVLSARQDGGFVASWSTLDAYGNGIATRVFTGDFTAPTYTLLSGTEGADTLTGGTGHDQITGLGGNDSLNGGANGDILDGGAGNDTLLGGAGQDQLLGGASDDLLLDTDTAMSTARPAISGFTSASGWTSQNSYPRLLADVNGDGQDDLIAFSSVGITVAIGQQDGTFATIGQVVSGYGTSSGWTSQSAYPRLMADVNGDGRADVVAFGGASVYVLPGRANGTFGTAYVASNQFTTGQGWSGQDATPRALADVNGDGRADIVGFSNSGTYVALAGADGTFGAMFQASVAFAGNGWASQNTTPRLIGDVNGDGRSDVVGFAANGIQVALGQSDGTFLDLGQVAAGFGTAAGWTSQDAMPRQLADINGDGYADIVGFGSSGVFVMEGQADGRFGPQYSIGSQFTGSGWSSQDQAPRLLGDINGDGAADIVGFGGPQVTVSLTAFDADTLMGGDGNDTLNGGRGADLLDGGSGTDTVSYAGASAAIHVDLAAGRGYSGDAKGDILVAIENLEGGSGNDTLEGDATANWLIGGSGSDLLYGRDGNDTLDGGAGIDTLTGGAGNDTYLVSDAGDVIVETAGEGTDEVRTTLASYTLAANVENLVYTGTAAFTGTGNTGNNAITGGAGNDSLTGDAGNDTLDGGIGADTMVGGTGNDTYIADNAGDVVTELAGQGTDTVRTSLASYTLGANVEHLVYTGTGPVTFTGNALNNNLTGGAGADLLTGLDGNDTLNGGAGADTLVGGTGNDTYVVDNAGDVLVELPGEGIDTVQSSISHTLLADFENLTLTGSAALTGTGNTLNNLLTGNGAANLLTGLEGDDTLNGGGGADTLIGGIGNDSYVVDNAGDVVTELVGEGIDTVNASINWTLGANLENLTLTGSAAISATGNELDNILIGNSGANVLDGGLGADSMAGGAGNDVYLVDDAGDVVTELAGQGIDEVRTTLSSYLLGANIEVLTYIGTGDFAGTGNALDNLLTGGLGTDTLSGGDGADTLDGGAGSNLLIGGAGNDVYLVGGFGDQVVELAGEGIDEVRTALTGYTLTDGVENLTYTGVAAFAGTGNALDNLIVGGAGADTLDGRSGADTLIGGLGDDVYVVDSIGDTVIEGTDAGTDEVRTTLSAFTLSDNVERLVFQGGGDASGTGNGLDNWLAGNTGNDTLDGGAGNDTLMGSLGADALTGGSGADLFVFISGDGQDTITDFDAAQGDRIGLAAGQSYSVDTNANGDAVIVYGTSDIVTLVGIQPAAVSSAWFVTL